MFILGGLGEERTVPVGASFSDRGMRNDQHDAVAAQLMIPIRQIFRGNVPPAAGGAPQPAETASHAEQHFSRAAGGGPQPAEAPSDADQPTSPAAVAVAPQLMTPIRRIWKARAPAPQSADAPSDADQPTSPAAGGAPQPADASSDAKTHAPPAAGGAPQPADAPSDAEQPISPDWEATNAQQDTLVQDTALNKAARDLHENLLVVEEAEDIPVNQQHELRKILFKKKTVTVGGFKRQYVATLDETFDTIKNLLQRRRDFMAARRLHDAQPPSGGASQPADHRYVFTQEDRRQVMQEWKNEFHAAPEQEHQQKRDSWKPTGPPPDAHNKSGPNTKAVHSGKHSRFARHLQLAAGSKTMAELIIYTGRFDPEFLNKAHEAQDRNGASQPVASADRQKALKKKAAQAKLDYRMTCMLRLRLDRHEVYYRDLERWEQENLRRLEDGSLLRHTNEAVAAYGHGTLRRDDGETIEIGGSTGGITRFLLDGYAEPDVDSFLRKR